MVIMQQLEKKKVYEYQKLLMLWLILKFEQEHLQKKIYLEQ
jgi:hypothetical protein